MFPENLLYAGRAAEADHDHFMVEDQRRGGQHSVREDPLNVCHMFDLGVHLFAGDDL